MRNAKKWCAGLSDSWNIFAFFNSFFIFYFFYFILFLNSCTVNLGWKMVLKIFKSFTLLILGIISFFNVCILFIYYFLLFFLKILPFCFSNFINQHQNFKFKIFYFVRNPRLIPIFFFTTPFSIYFSILCCGMVNLLSNFLWNKSPVKVHK